MIRPGGPSPSPSLLGLLGRKQAGRQEGEPQVRTQSGSWKLEETAVGFSQKGSRWERNREALDEEDPLCQTAELKLSFLASKQT